ncbi:MAG: SLBB domain-containing protein [Balneolaceae bacterium]|nr:SLBB domain-containing protein [Balneolaceae bacterium]
MLATGDQLIVDIWGAAQMTYQLEVSPDWMVLIDNLGPVQLSGLTIEEARQRLYERLGTIYSGLSPDNENQKDTYMQVSLGQIRSINVTVMGESTMPGTYTLPSLATVFNALYASAGPNVNGSFRHINIIRGDSVAATFDLYDILINGDRSGDILLRSQDMIQIKPYTNRVAISGQVKRPGLYEVEEGENDSRSYKICRRFHGSGLHRPGDRHRQYPPRADRSRRGTGQLRQCSTWNRATRCTRVRSWTDSPIWWRSRARSTVPANTSSPREPPSTPLSNGPTG